MTLKDYHKFTLGTSDHLTKCRVLWGGAELFFDYFSRLDENAQCIKIRVARYDEKYDVLTAYATDRGYIEYRNALRRNALRRKQHCEGRYNKYDHKKKGGL